MRVGLLECDHVDDRFRGIDGDYYDMFASLLDVDLVRYDTVNGELPAEPDACDGWLATGSRFSVYDDLDWIGSLQAFVRSVHGAGVPYVGICFGHQLLAHALGGRTEKAPVGWGVGAIETQLDPPAVDGPLLYMHQDQVVAVPPDAVVTGRTEHCPVAMLQVGRCMAGIQAHPEFTPRYVDALLDVRAERIGHEVVARAKESLALVDGRHDAEEIGRWIVRFLSGAA